MKQQRLFNVFIYAQRMVLEPKARAKGQKPDLAKKVEKRVKKKLEQDISMATEWHATAAGAKSIGMQNALLWFPTEDGWTGHFVKAIPAQQDAKPVGAKTKDDQDQVKDILGHWLQQTLPLAPKLFAAWSLLTRSDDQCGLLTDHLFQKGRAVLDECCEIIPNEEEVKQIAKNFIKRSLETNQASTP